MGLMTVHGVPVENPVSLRGVMMEIAVDVHGDVVWQKDEVEHVWTVSMSGSDLIIDDAPVDCVQMSGNEMILEDAG